MLAQRPAATKRGFTLLEVLLVLAILAVICALVVPQLMGRQELANIDATRLSLKGLEQAIRLYSLDHSGAIPDERSGLSALVTAPSNSRRWRGPYLNELPKDAWGNLIAYEAHGRRGSRATFLLRSPGPDGALNTQDDITSDKPDGS